jgi:hypothetical protein
MNLLRRLVILCLAAGCATGAAAADALYSFNDLYRLTVNGAIAEPGTAPLPMNEAREQRVSSAEPVATSEFRFTITPVPGPGRWPLLLAGVAAAAWVAHRRLTRPL